MAASARLLNRPACCLCAGGQEGGGLLVDTAVLAQTKPNPMQKKRGGGKWKSGMETHKLHK